MSNVITGDTTWDIIIWIICSLVVFITGGGLSKLIVNIKKNGKKVNISELKKELENNFKSIRKIKKTIDKETKKMK